MLFKDNFYTITSKSEHEENHIYSLQLNAEHAIFEGHFPGNPVTPGVVQMEIIKELLQESTGKPHQLQTMGNCKFLAILNPETNAEVDVTLKLSEGENGEQKLSAVIQNASTVFLKMNAAYLPA